MAYNLNGKLYSVSLREKAGEIGAAANLTRPISDATLGCIVAAPRAKNMSDGDLIRERVGDVINAFPDAPVIWDCQHMVFDADNPDEDAAHLANLLAQFRKYKAKIVPALSLTEEFFRATTLAAHSRLTGSGLCVKVDYAQIGDWDKLRNTLEPFNIATEDCILSLDVFGADMAQHHEFAEFLLAHIGALQKMGRWAGMIVRASSFPLKNPAPDDGQHRILRDEWLVWRELIRARPELAKAVIFGDFGADNSAIDFKGGGRPIPHFRFSGEDDCMVVRGNRGVRDSIRDVAKRTIGLPAFKDKRFSYGDEFVASCADRTGGPGNPMQWRLANMNHHITQVVVELARLYGVSLGDYHLAETKQGQLFGV